MPLDPANPRRQPELYWRELEQLKAAAVCIRLCRNQLAQRLRAVDFVKAIASSGGIAGWVVWRDYPLVWAGIIAAAQLLDAVKHVFPFARQHKAASELTAALELLFIDAQHEWERIYAGLMPDEQIMNAQRKIRKLRLETERKFFPEGLDPPPALARLASKEAQAYIVLAYGERALDERL